MFSTKKIASPAEVLEFANKVRAAGGGNPLDALMPAVPADPHACLIARNLNFDCYVDANGSGGEWVMWVDDPEVRDKIASALNLKKTNGDEHLYGVILPATIGRVADSFDKIEKVFLTEIEYSRDDEAYYSCEEDWGNIKNFNLKKAVEDIVPTQRERRILMEILPLIEAAENEARDLATVVNPDGSIVL